MCGVFAWITRDGSGPDVGLLKTLAAVTETRGNHAFGLAWADRDGRLATFKRPGPATAALDDLERCRDAVAVIGHCRWATHGSPDDNRNNHPHAAGKGWLVHNGVVADHIALARRHGLIQRTQCDSEVLGLLIPKMPGKLLRRGLATAKAAQGNLAVLGLWANPVRLLAIRDTRPLHFGLTSTGVYFASLATGLPGPQLLKDARGMLMTWTQNELYLESGNIG